MYIRMYLCMYIRTYVYCMYENRNNEKVSLTLTIVIVTLPSMYVVMTNMINCEVIYYKNN